LNDVPIHSPYDYSELAAAIGRLREAADSSIDGDSKRLPWTDWCHRLESLEQRARDLAADTGNNRLILAQALHDMRGMLTVLRMNTDMIVRATRDPERVEDLCRHILKACDDLLGLLVELLILSQSDVPHFPLNVSSVSVREELDSLLGCYLAQAREKGLGLEWKFAPGLPERLKTDSLRLRRSVGNLLANAIKFTDRGKVSVEIAHDKETLSVRVTDTGPGVPADIRETLFEPFRQAPEIQGKHGGFGLGLSVARRLSRGMGGDVVLQDSPSGKGTSVLLFLKAETGGIKG